MYLGYFIDQAATANLLCALPFAAHRLRPRLLLILAWGLAEVYGWAGFEVLLGQAGLALAGRIRLWTALAVLLLAIVWSFLLDREEEPMHKHGQFYTKRMVANRRKLAQLVLVGLVLGVFWGVLVVLLYNLHAFFTIIDFEQNLPYFMVGIALASTLACLVQLPAFYLRGCGGRCFRVATLLLLAVAGGSIFGLFFIYSRSTFTSNMVFFLLLGAGLGCWPCLLAWQVDILSPCPEHVVTYVALLSACVMYELVQILFWAMQDRAFFLVAGGLAFLVWLGLALVWKDQFDPEESAPSPGKKFL